MTSDLTRCNCCGLGCGDGCDACNGTFYPSSVSVSFTPHFLGAWTGDISTTGCNGSGHTEPSCPTVITTLGDYPEWFSSPKVTLTFTSSGDSSCEREYTCTEVTVEEPTGIPDWTDNPIGLPATASKWCDIETAMDCFGSGEFFESWSGELTLSADRCDDTGTGGTATNTLLAHLSVDLNHHGTIASDTVLSRRFLITSSETDCSCFLPDYGSGSWASHCPGNDCYPGSTVSAQALKTDWGNDFGKGSETVTWTTDSGDCCENRSVDLYYLGGYIAGQTPSHGCGDIEDSVTCPGYDDGWRVFQISWPLEDSTPSNKGTVHYAKQYAGDTGLACFEDCIVTGEYGFSFSSYPALTDISIDAP